MLEGYPSTVDYIRWLSVEVGDLPKVFTGMNENFVSTAFKALSQWLAILLISTPYKMLLLPVVLLFCLWRGLYGRLWRAVAKNWWWSFGYDYVLDAIRTRLREVISSILFCLFLPDCYNYFGAL
jgi:hypothetical protein